MFKVIQQRRDFMSNFLKKKNSSVATDRSDFAVKAIKLFVNFGSRGLFPAFISKALCCASLTALSKKKGGVCPIAVGEVLRRLIAKCLVSEAKSGATELFDSLQLGVSISGSAEAIIRQKLHTIT